MMIRSVGRTIILVHDYDEALAFYTERLGFETLFDAVGEEGLRFVHVGLPEQPGVGLWFMQATTPEQRARVGNQTGGEPLLVLYTDDCVGTYESLSTRGVSFLSEPRSEPNAVVAHFTDLYGNHLVLVELSEDRQGAR